jgi:hypothetical protein
MWYANRVTYTTGKYTNSLFRQGKRLRKARVQSRMRRASERAMLERWSDHKHTQVNMLLCMFGGPPCMN